MNIFFMNIKKQNVKYGWIWTVPVFDLLYDLILVIKYLIKKEACEPNAI